MPVPVITIAQMRVWEEQSWAAGCSVEAVMDRAGQAVAQQAAGMSRVGDMILFLAGPGNNGGDTRLAAKHLAKREIRLVELADPGTALGDLAAGLESRPALIIDGVFGNGLNRPLEGAWSELVNQVNGSGIPVLAVDVPSGLNADTGQSLGNAIRANATVTFAAPKAGMVNTAAAEFIGRLEVVPDIGLVNCPHDSDLGWALREDFDGFPPARPMTSHKGDFGHLGIIAGSLGCHGAAVLAARGAMRAQPGLITVVTPADVYVPVASQLSQPMVYPWSASAADKLLGCTALLVGPGLAGENLPREIKNEVVRLWHESPVPVIADASALDMLPSEPVATKVLRVITPHPGEAARLLGTTAAEVQSGRLQALRKLAGQHGGTVVLKGSQTLVGGVEGQVAVNSTGNPHLAQGGSGDVLAGFISGWLAQPACQSPPLAGMAIRYAVWRHGQAADRMPGQLDGWGAEELIRHLK